MKRTQMKTVKRTHLIILLTALPGNGMSDPPIQCYNNNGYVPVYIILRSVEVLRLKLRVDVAKFMGMPIKGPQATRLQTRVLAHLRQLLPCF